MNDKELWELGKKSKLFEKFKHLFSEDDVFWNNEIKANLFTMFILLSIVAVLILSYFLAYVGIFAVPLSTMKQVLKLNLPVLFIAMALCQAFKGSKRWVKFVLIIACVTSCTALASIVSIYVSLMLVIPVCLSVRYYSRKFTIFVALLTIVCMIGAEVAYAYYGVLDLNLIPIDRNGVLINVTNGDLRSAISAIGYDMPRYIDNLFRGSFAPRMLFFSIVSTVCAELSRRAHEMVLDQAEISQKTESIKTELGMATHIQDAVLPKIFPAFPAHPELDIYAKMDPAKEVGGDFYDYYLIDEDHLLMVVADVSGKGVPAALFMMISKILIKTYAGVYKDPVSIAKAVNTSLCEGNEAEMFVTAWIGVLELSTGKFRAVDCGHEFPYVKRKNGNFESIKNKKSFVLAGMDTVKFKEFEFDFNRGDTIFMYTDGVPEATNANNVLYTTDRLEKCLNKFKDDSPSDLLIHVREDIDAFVKEAPQFDDLTMLAMHFKENN